VAGILKLRPATVRRMAALGQIGYHRLNGKELRFAQADLDELLARTRIQARESA
jgi:excisionase family DNA binding protein